MSKLRVLMLPTNPGGVTYYRFYLPALALNSLSTKVEVVNMSPEEGRGVEKWSHDLEEGEVEWLLRKAREVDVIHGGWTNVLGQLEGFVAARHTSQHHLLLDQDDDTLSVEVNNLNYRYYHEGAQGRKITRLGMRTADGVTVSTVPLEEAIGENCNSTYLLPNYCYPLHMDLPQDPQRGDDKSVRLMFAGGPSHVGDYQAMKEAVTWALDYYDGKEGRPHLKVFFLCCMPEWAAPYIADTRTPTANRIFYLQHTGYSTHLWRRIIKWVAPDIFVAPLLHNTFNRSKSDCKVYDAALTPTCAFACEDYAPYDGVPSDTCVKVNSHVDGAWQRSLTDLIERVDMRRDLGARLGRWVLDERDIRAYISKWEDVYAAALSRPLVSSLADVKRPRILGPDGQPALDTL